MNILRSQVVMQLRRKPKIFMSQGNISIHYRSCCFFFIRLIEILIQNKQTKSYLHIRKSSPYFVSYIQDYNIQLILLFKHSIGCILIVFLLFTGLKICCSFYTILFVFYMFLLIICLSVLWKCSEKQAFTRHWDFFQGKNYISLSLWQS